MPVVSKICQVGNHPFSLEGHEVEAYKKFGFEPLPICFPHQHQWRLSFRNDRFLHRRKCDLTGKYIISMYPPTAPYKIYDREVWFGDKWDPMNYGRDYDFTRGFFEQYAELQMRVPRMSLVNMGSINSDYCNSCVYNKNCYLIFGGDRNEDCMYGALPMFCKNCVDCDWTVRCELCYFCAYLEDSYGCRFSFHSVSCSDCAFVEDCIGCDECILSFNLRHKKYYIENKSYSKEEYFKKKAQLLDGTYTGQQILFERFKELRKNRIVKYGHIINGHNVSGDIISNAKNCINCYEIVGGEDLQEVFMGFNIKDCFNSDYLGEKTQLNYNNVSTDTAYATNFSYFIISSSNIEYSEAIISSKNILGCIGVKHKEYCIFNKQYSPKEFKDLRARIIEHMKSTGEWGWYFPRKLSTFPYNNSTASFYMPISKEEAVSQGFNWLDEEKADSQADLEEIPNNIADAKDTICDSPLTCKDSGKTYLITRHELDFYRKQNIPIPRQHSDRRYIDRLSLRNPLKLWTRTCAKCNSRIQTTYSTDRRETVYCEKCYMEAVY